MKSALSPLGQRTDNPAISWLMGLTLSRPELISLAAGFTDSESLPVAEARALLDELLRSKRTGRVALQYGSTQGDPELRRLTAQWVERSDGARSGSSLYSPDRLVITHGSQQLLYILSEALFAPGEVMLVEDPTYFVTLGIAQSHGIRCRGVRMETDGIDLAHLKRVLDKLKLSGDLPRLKLLYLVSYFQNPTGTTTSWAKKAGALGLLRHYERAAGHRLYLLEDAAYRELRFAGDDVPSALTCQGAAERVIYTGTFSKPFATGVRVGYGFLPEPLLSVGLRIKGNHDFGTANLLQRLLARALASGKFEQHLAVLRARYARKAKIMDAAMRRHFPPGVEWLMPHGGLYHWPRLPGRIKTGRRSKLFRTTLARNVLYVPGELCYADDPTRPKPDCEMRLSFGGASETDIREGIAQLGQAMQKLTD
ncbi:MAG: PLP-dependent aminotransferase family protein [Verrucomicrobia bacterium]|nr:PLP-dependent aminotransferase family protein [Verrucomicrobiota bacterium]